MSGFGGFFEAVTGHAPFRWQADLADRLASGSVPGAVAIPTGLGKTAVIEAWAWGAAHNRAVPTRLVFVVDRRLIVDQAYDRAVALARSLQEGDAPAVKEVAAGLAARGGDIPLAVQRMRGGVTWESRWTRSPLQPTIVTATVDQAGSRLLFRGYGTSSTMRPIDAALVGIDAWIVIDEAHLSEPFLATVRRVVGLQDAERALGLRSVHATVMSATLPEEIPTSDAIAPSLEELLAESLPDAAAVVTRRLTTPKPVHLAELGFVKGRKVRDRAERLGSALAAIAAKTAASVRAEGSEPVVGVVANTVAAARAAFDALREDRTVGGWGAELVLLMGRVREHERSRIVRDDLRGALAGRARDRDRPMFVVATQTIEVGADLDLDLLVTEAAPLSALVQRFGRVNRRGEGLILPSVIAFAPDHHDDDPVYGATVAGTWRDVLLRHGEPSTFEKLSELRAWSPAGDGTLDLSPAAAVELLGSAPDSARVASPFVPVLTGAHIERLMRTHPTPMPDQPVAPFLRGVERDVPTVSVAWRTFGAAGDEADLASLLELAPVRSWEFVDVPIGELRRLFEPDVDVATGDVELTSGELPEEIEGIEVPGLVLRDDGVEPLSASTRVRPGDRVVLDTRTGGYDRWGWTGDRSHAPVPDVGNLAPTARVYRVDPLLLEQGGVPPEISARLREVLEDLEEGELTTLGDVLAAAGIDPVTVPDAHDRLSWVGSVVKVADRPILFARRPARSRSVVAEIDDTSVEATSMVGLPTTLEDHGDAVGSEAERVAIGLDLDPELVEAVRRAGRWHDLGKADPRFQAMLYDGDELAAASGPLRAKSGRDPSDPIARRAREVARVPRGFRHEALSARIVDRYGEEAGDDVELISHLVNAHHGRGRPLQTPLVDRAAGPLEIPVEGRRITVEPSEQQVDLAQAGRFEKLCERYGPWGLAYLEAIVRLADMACSEEGR